MVYLKIPGQKARPRKPPSSGKQKLIVLNKVDRKSNTHARLSVFFFCFFLSFLGLKGLSEKENLFRFTDKKNNNVKDTATSLEFYFRALSVTLRMFGLLEAWNLENDFSIHNSRKQLKTIKKFFLKVHIYLSFFFFFNMRFSKKMFFRR